VSPSEFDRDFARLEAELKRLEAEYTMYFAGRLPKPPWETRSRVAALMKQYDRMYIQNTGDKFRFTTLQTRYATFVDLWDRGLRAKEEGRPGPFTHTRADKEPEKKKKVEDRVVHTSSFRDPTKEADELAELYKSIAEARREVGDEPVPFEKFASLVKTQVQKLRKRGGEVSFQVAVKDGKVSFTARALKGSTE
jgi:hypothetical protein